MDRPQSDIIPFIAKQLNYKLVPVDVLIDVCISAYSTADIVNARNIVIDALGDKCDFSLPRPTRTSSLRTDLLCIFHYLGKFPCPVGQEQAYREHIESLALVTRLDGMSEIVHGLCNTLQPNVTMPSHNLQPQGQSSGLVDGGNQDAAARRQEDPMVIPLPQPINHENIHLIQQPPVNNSNGLTLPGIGVDQVSAPLPDLGLQALSVNPPVAPLPPIQLMVRSDQQNRDDARVSSLSVEVVSPPIVREDIPAIQVPPVPASAPDPTPALAADPTPALATVPTAAPNPVLARDPTPAAAPIPALIPNPALAPASTPALAPVPASAPGRAPTPDPGSSGDNAMSQDESLTDPGEDDISSLTSINTSTSSSDTSEEDNLPLSFYNPERFPKSGRLLIGPLGRQALRPRAAPATRRFEGRPPRSQPIPIPAPTRLLTRAEDWVSDDESARSDSEPTSSKRRRSERRPE